MKKAGLHIKFSAVSAPQILESKKFVVIGLLDHFTRDQTKNKITSLGGQALSAVRKNTDYVLAGADPGSKYDKTKKLGLKIIDEDEFLRMIIQMNKNYTDY